MTFRELLKTKLGTHIKIHLNTSSCEFLITGELVEVSGDSKSGFISILKYFVNYNFNPNSAHKSSTYPDTKTTKIPICKISYIEDVV